MQAMLLHLVERTDVLLSLPRRGHVGSILPARHGTQGLPMKTQWFGRPCLSETVAGSRSVGTMLRLRFHCNLRLQNHDVCTRNGLDRYSPAEGP